MDPLHVTMTGVRMGERFLQIGVPTIDCCLADGGQGGSERRVQPWPAFDEASADRAALGRRARSGR